MRLIEFKRSFWPAISSWSPLWLTARRIAAEESTAARPARQMEIASSRSCMGAANSGYL
jgi:hypothetical protein